MFYLLGITANKGHLAAALMSILKIESTFGARCCVPFGKKFLPRRACASSSGQQSHGYFVMMDHIHMDMTARLTHLPPMRCDANIISTLSLMIYGTQIACDPGQSICLCLWICKQKSGLRCVVDAANNSAAEYWFWIAFKCI